MVRRARQIVGISLPPQVAQAFKAEARRRCMPIRELFQELWTAYEPPMSNSSVKNSAVSIRALGGAARELNRFATAYLAAFKVEHDDD